MPIPPNYLRNIQILNPSYINWTRLNSLFSTVSQGISSHVRKVIALEQWKKLENVFRASTQARVVELRAQLQNLNKERMYVFQYIKKVMFATIREPVTCTNMLLYVIGGLGPCYNSFVTSLNMRETKPS